MKNYQPQLITVRTWEHRPGKSQYDGCHHWQLSQNCQLLDDAQPITAQLIPKNSDELGRTQTPHDDWLWRRQRVYDSEMSSVSRPFFFDLCLLLIKVHLKCHNQNDKEVWQRDKGVWQHDKREWQHDKDVTSNVTRGWDCVTRRWDNVTRVWHVHVTWQKGVTV